MEKTFGILLSGVASNVKGGTRGPVARADENIGASGAADCRLKTDVIFSDGFPIENWQDWLHEGQEDDAHERIRPHTRTGRPLGADSFISKIEVTLGRRVRALPIGRQKGWRKKRKNE
ncbi:MAG TPA: hypothetical protein HPP83_01385 [Candidatus Hydrogenedentes bacterium]|nr:hypothetical protein [Candidatus Hydrogenedentota bacterium]